MTKSQIERFLFYDQNMGRGDGHNRSGNDHAQIRRNLIAHEDVHIDVLESEGVQRFQYEHGGDVEFRLGKVKVSKLMHADVGDPDEYWSDLIALDDDAIREAAETDEWPEDFHNARERKEIFEEYLDAFKRGETPPPIAITKCGDMYRILDRYHRSCAALNAEVELIDAYYVD